MEIHTSFTDMLEFSYEDALHSGLHHNPNCSTKDFPKDVSYTTRNTHMSYTNETSNEFIMTPSMTHATKTSEFSMTSALGVIDDSYFFTSETPDRNLTSLISLTPPSSPGQEDVGSVGLLHQEPAISAYSNSFQALPQNHQGSSDWGAFPMQYSSYSPYKPGKSSSSQVTKWPPVNYEQQSQYDNYDISLATQWHQLSPLHSVEDSDMDQSTEILIPQDLCAKCNKVKCSCVQEESSSRGVSLECSKCYRSFSYAKRLYEHEAVCTAEQCREHGHVKVTQLKCSRCSKEFKSIRWLEWHQTNKCTRVKMCDATYIDDFNSTDNDIINSLEKQVMSSPVCNQPVVMKPKRGRKPKASIYRKQPARTSISSVSSEEDFPSYTRAGRHCCGLCDASFSFDTNLTRHQRNIHGKRTVRKSRSSI